LAKIKLAMSANVHVLRPMLIERVKPIRRSALTVTDKVVVIAISTGGPRTLAQLLPRLPGDFPAALLIVQHMPEGFTGAMAERLNTETQITVREARHKDAVVQETALIAPGGVHMKVKIGNSGHGRIVLEKGARELGLIPTANVTMRAVAPLYRERCLGVVLTGMGSDGTDGLRQIKRHGGRTLAQDKDSCVVYGMPKSAAEAEVVDKVLPLEGMASEITRWARGK
jgi:two-component system, chemotaxis family, protein-glutamate methylesterase/glutaminase